MSGRRRGCPTSGTPALGGALADAVSCNPVVKAFGAETREEARLQWVVGKWQQRTRRTWMRGTNNGTAQLLALLALRTAVIGLVLWLWWHGQATPGDVAYVLTAYFIIQGYLRDIGWHIRDLQKSVNDMEELVDDPRPAAGRRGSSRTRSRSPSTVAASSSGCALPLSRPQHAAL